MSDESNGVEKEKAEEKVDNEEDELNKCKKIKISNDDSQIEDTKPEISEALKDASESTDLTVNSKDSSPNNSDLVVSNGDNSTKNSDNTSSNSEPTNNSDDISNKSEQTNNSDNTSNKDEPTNNSDNASDESESTNNFDNISNKSEPTNNYDNASNNSEPTNNSDNSRNNSEQEESASSDVVKNANIKPVSTASNTDSPEDNPKHSSVNDTESEQSDSIQNDDRVNKSENDSNECEDLVTDNEKEGTAEADSDDKNDKSKASGNFLKNGEETLYEILNNPMDVQDDTNTNEKSEISNGSTEKTDAADVQDESKSTEITKNDEITSKELLDILQEKDKLLKKKVLIIDVREAEEYCTSRMSFHDNLINIPAEKIQKNKVPGYYRYILLYDIEAEKKFTRRSHYDVIILVDKNSELKTMESDSKIAIFKNCLEEYDVHIDYKRIAVLKGGFEEWANSHPDFVTKS